MWFAQDLSASEWWSQVLQLSCYTLRTQYLIVVLFCLQKQGLHIWKIQDLYDSVSVVDLGYGV